MDGLTDFSCAICPAAEVGGAAGAEVATQKQAAITMTLFEDKCES